MKANCTSTVTHTLQGGSGVAVRIRAHTLQVSSQNGVSLSCDLTQALCSFTLDGLLHGQRKNIYQNQFYCHCLLTCLFFSAQVRLWVCSELTTMKPGMTRHSPMDLRPKVWTVFWMAGSLDRWESNSHAHTLCRNEFRSVLIKCCSGNWHFVMSHRAVVYLSGQKQPAARRWVCFYVPSETCWIASHTSVLAGHWSQEF